MAETCDSPGGAVSASGAGTRAARAWRPVGWVGLTIGTASAAAVLAGGLAATALPVLLGATVTRAAGDPAAVACVGLALVATLLPLGHARPPRELPDVLRGVDRATVAAAGAWLVLVLLGRRVPRGRGVRPPDGRAGRHRAAHVRVHPRRGPRPPAHRGLRGGRARLRRGAHPRPRPGAAAGRAGRGPAGRADPGRHRSRGHVGRPPARRRHGGAARRRGRAVGRRARRRPRGGRAPAPPARRRAPPLLNAGGRLPRVRRRQRGAQRRAAGLLPRGVGHHRLRLARTREVGVRRRAWPVSATSPAVAWPLGGCRCCAGRASRWR